MPVFSGNTSGSIASIAKNIPSEIVSYSLVNQTGGSITVTVTIIPNGGTPVDVWSGSIAANATQSDDKNIVLLSGYQILVTTTGSVDYYFSYK
jgi:hypothetical protein